MARRASRLELGLGVGLIVVGVIMIVTQFEIPFVTEAIGAVLIGLATYFLYRGKVRLVSVGLVVVGVLLLLTHLMSDLDAAVNQVLSIVIGALIGLLGVLVIFGFLHPKGEEPTESASEADGA